MSSPTRGAPAEMRKPINRFRQYVTEETDLLRLVASALQSAARQKELAEALYQLNMVERGEDQVQTLVADRDRQIAFAEAAAKEAERGFPRLCAHTIVAIWAAVEVMVEDTIVSALLTDLTKADTARLDRIRLPFGQFEMADREERIRAAAGQILQDESAHGGLTRFENALGVVGLSGRIDESDSRTLWELQNIRNVIVHNGGLAAQRLIERCPWLGLKRGQELIVSMEQVFKYGTAAAHYAYALLGRISDRYEGV